MGKVVSFNRECLLPKHNNAELAQYLREVADGIERGEYGPLEMSTLVLVANGKVKQYHQTTRHFTTAEAIGIFAYCQHQILTNDYESEDDA